MSAGRPDGGAQRRRIVDRSLLPGQAHGTGLRHDRNLRRDNADETADRHQSAKNRDDDAPVRAPTRIET
jgi:hypothetical protein